MPFYAYIVRCRDGSLYTGWTDDPERRVRVHNEGRGGRYTRSHLPVTLVYLEEHASKNAAMSRERAIKKMSRGQKNLLIEAKTRTGVP
ncbi:MAG: GIY-YIG nuclease family protein [Synergistaceae bacterium]|jgi:putative endonuclease|nr:GIY-YIG nuclease family protein [Synergistaceae bacterium]